MKAGLPWAVNMPDTAFAVLFGGSKVNVARVLQAEKMRARHVRDLHDMIDMVGLTEPAQANAYRTAMHRALVASR